MVDAKKLLIPCVVLVLLICAARCSTLQLSPDATAAQKKASMCSDAQMGYALSTAMLETVLAPPVNKYWQAYKAGASLALQTYCGGFSPPPSGPGPVGG